MNIQLQLFSSDLLEQYCREVNIALEESFNNLKDAEISSDNFSFYTSVASVFSSR